MLSLRSLLVVLVVWAAASPAWIADGSSTGNPPSGHHQEGNIPSTSIPLSPDASPLHALEERVLIQLYRHLIRPPLVAMVAGPFRDFEMKCHKQLKKGPNAVEAATPVTRALFALHGLIEDGVALARTHGATSAKPYILRDTPFGGDGFWMTWLTVPAAIGVLNVRPAIPEKLQLLRLPRRFTDTLNPATRSFLHPTLNAWFLNHDYVFPLPPLPAGVSQQDDENWLVLGEQAKVTGKYRLTEQQVEFVVEDVLCLFYYLSKGYRHEEKDTKANLYIVLDDLIGQSTFVKAMQKVHGERPLSPLVLFLTYGAEEQAFKMIRNANLVITKHMFLEIVNLGLPQVLTRLCKLAHKKRIAGYDWAPLKSTILTDLQDTQKMPSIDSDTKDRLRIAVEDCLYPKGRRRRFISDFIFAGEEE